MPDLSRWTTQSPHYEIGEVIIRRATLREFFSR